MEYSSLQAQARRFVQQHQEEIIADIARLVAIKSVGGEAAPGAPFGPGPRSALTAALDSGALRGAALDVTEPEPLPQDSPLWDIPNLLLTPHVAGGMRLEITRRTCVQMAQDNLRRYLAGEPLVNRVR